ncbi:PD-(D/E)XK nuclease family protein [Pseudonocardia sp. N23]|uniref:RecB family exonuclease n=1 Tax=Pseudonocardia sp. N23 TaxID=1987376 RepID=UPI000BFC2E8A|nr:PD-(D/E)XK nuclease family protein [Pseudonocardia sp. N23]GAY13257.1 RecB family exonuclease [Pseudonocardia sp. N23]
MGADTGQLGFDLGVDVRPLPRVTPARLASWESCPRRFRMAYIDRPAPARGGAWAHHTLGAVVHLALRALFDLPARARTPEAAEALLDRNWSAEGYRDSAQSARYRTAARGWLAAYTADHELHDPTAAPAGVERWVSETVGAGERRLVAEGRVDRIDTRGADAVVVDYKTGRHVPTDDDARDSRALALYAAATGAALHRPCRRVELHHVPTGHVAVWEHDDASMRAHLDAAHGLATAAADAGDALAAGGDPEALFPPRTSPACATCDVRRHCPEGRAAAPSPQPWAYLRDLPGAEGAA